jgi:hypothetical protein
MIRFLNGTGATGVLLAAIVCATVLLFIPQPAEPAPGARPYLRETLR